MAYNPYTSHIAVMSQALTDYRSDYDQIKAAEMHYERMRTINNTTLLQIDISKSSGNILGSLSLDSIWNSPKDSAIEAALAELRSTVFARAVGPLEQLPVGDYIQDSKRAKDVATHTQFGAEQRLVAKYSQMRGNTLNPNQQAQGSAMSATSYSKMSDSGKILHRTLPENGAVTPDELSSAKYNAEELAMSRSIVRVDENKTEKTLKNRWSKTVPYFPSPIASDRFTFMITNLASSGPPMSFPAYIRNLNEGISPAWNNISLINRSEDIYVYQKAERSFNFEFVLFASTQEIDSDKANAYNKDGFPSVINIDGEEIGVMSKKMMWDRVNFMHGLTRPSYTSDGKFDRAPYCKLYIGGLFNGISVIFDSVNINYDPLIWDLNVDENANQIKPMVAQITTSGKFIHDVPPSTDHNFYGEK